ncbi:MAG: FG-GAP-like repeat-containing protein [Candidatus Sumerlaeia bacterium]|nr:FG-GAP-like repeat-containing protein [Candidatus Sumerlaeia bacterium]
MNKSHRMCSRAIAVPLLLLTAHWTAPSHAGQSKRGVAWACHVIDNTSRGADGTRLADVNGDGLPDITTGWEQGGVVRAYLHPGYPRVRAPWPAVTVGPAGSVEDAVFADLDGDGATDVVSACEGKVRTLFVHWAPKAKDRYLEAAAWKTEAIPASRNAQQWMFSLPLDINGDGRADLVAGGKNQNASVGWFALPPDARDSARWQWHALSRVGWLMSLFAEDMDGDGDRDIVLTDRRGDLRGCRWLENPGLGAAQTQPWVNHFIGGRDREMMFMVLADLDRDGALDVVAATTSDILWFHRAGRDVWQSVSIPLPDNVGTGKGVAVADINNDGRPDIVLSCENAKAEKSGVVWLAYQGNLADNRWQAREISGVPGTKYDMVVPSDLDGDGDLDIITTEEVENLGVIWYENPLR